MSERENAFISILHIIVIPNQVENWIMWCFCCCKHDVLDQQRSGRGVLVPRRVSRAQK